MGQKLSSNLKASSDIKLLMFGSNTSGKLSFIKQTQLIYQGGRSGDDAQKIKTMMRFSLCIVIKEIIRFIHSTSQESIKKSWLKFKRMDIDSDIDIKLAKSLFKNLMDLWIDTDFQNQFLPITKFKKEDTIYLIENAKRIISEDFIPNETDISKFRMKCTGTSDTRLEVEDCSYTFVDVGGQKCDRKKWIHHFEDVGAILFFVSFDEYDQPAENPKYENRMKESLSLFEENIVKCVKSNDFDQSNS
ncbi:G-protein subunit alpha 11 [Heterostelium album PN500]|uniref:G-protein subunit alpha 11 n=1 Tax=Heterostelium pallidum (strain ATCC 26659 / Pp 5 / PN500) TaxID=670386 RepID=D3BBQ1_HETP5|nr:G-protein subunit alpha 11 [Heterostelium album PN500]EFA81084.1 G-protein subunit alpha 11 [Heterostelium album PN500]|eukprot:XP_020433202.1 G-protein subunit alpha 11 [Heterostelium album PN500]